jgi:hypothetical protein
MTVQALKRRFDELLVQLDEIEKTKDRGDSAPEHVDGLMFLGWKVKARNLLSRACGADSEHYKQFQATEDSARYKNTYNLMLNLNAVFAAAKEDYEGGYLRSIRSLVHAELFDDELELASELLGSGYTVAAAVAARVVLETTIRKFCGDWDLPVRMPDGKSMKLDKLNADLAKAGAYDKLTQKEVTWLANIGNDGAHGDPIKEADAEAMITQVRRFVAEHPVK